MKRALVCVFLLACKGSSAPDKRAPDPTTPAPVPVAPTAESSPCYSFPFGIDAERAGIRRLAHRPTNLPSVTVDRKATRDPTFEQTIELAPGVPTTIDVLPRKGGPPFSVPGIGADAMVATAKVTGTSVTVTAPAHLDGAVVEITGETFVRAEIGENGRRALDLYQTRYVLKRYADAEGRYHRGHKLTALWPVAIIADDVDGDGKPELVALSRVDVQMPESDRPIDIPGPYDLAIIWLDSEEYTHAWLPSDATIYVVPPGLSGSKPMFVSLDRVTSVRGMTSLELTRIALEGRTLVQLDRSDEMEAEPIDDGLGPRDPRCLQTSSSKPATWAGQMAK